MTDQQIEDLKAKLATVWAEDDDRLEEVSIGVKQTVGGEMEISLCRMYEYMPMTFQHLERLAEVIGTKDFNVDNWSSGGCETCDYGSRYEHSITYKVPVG